MPFAALAVLMGGNVRVGLEDNLYLSRGVLATNGQLVERAVQILESMNVRVLGPARCGTSSAGAPCLSRRRPSNGRPARRRGDRRRLGGPLPAQRDRRRAPRPRSRGGRKVERDAGQRAPCLRRADPAPLPRRGRAHRGRRRSRRRSRASTSCRRARPSARSSSASCWPRRAGRRARTWSSRPRPRACCRRGCRPACRIRSGSCVGHPFNPVYLLPLVEVCGGDADRAGDGRPRGRGLPVGRHDPLHVRREIDGFVADRLLEALWREALWLVNDDVATGEEIDDAIRFGAGLRWAFMGTFLTYRIAGGEAGMRHFLAQFGPALKWPWTKLTDVPELTDELIEKLVAQSDDQAAGRTARELERLRDDCLVACCRRCARTAPAPARRSRGYERALLDRGKRLGRWPTGRSRPRCGCTARRCGPSGWTTTGTRTRAATCRCSATRRTGCCAGSASTRTYLAAGGSYYTVETHLFHLREARAGDRLRGDDAGARPRREAPPPLPLAVPSDDDTLVATRSRCCCTSTHGPGARHPRRRSFSPVSRTSLPGMRHPRRRTAWASASPCHGRRRRSELASGGEHLVQVGQFVVAVRPCAADGAVAGDQEAAADGAVGAGLRSPGRHRIR